MLPFEQMLLRLAVALVLGAVLGVERELVRKATGVRTEMLVAGGAAIFTMIALALPFITASSLGILPDAASVNASLSVIANIVIGIGFLGAGIIVKVDEHPHGVTTAALVWFTAAIGILVGIGLLEFATVAALVVALLLFGLRKFNVSDRLESESDKLRPVRKRAK